MNASSCSLSTVAGFCLKRKRGGGALCCETENYKCLKAYENIFVSCVTHRKLRTSLIFDVALRRLTLMSFYFIEVL